MPDQRSVSLGETAEIEAERYAISREQQDEFTLFSHLNAITEWDEGIYDREVVLVEGVGLGRDEAIGADTSVEALGTLKPAFRPNGSVTARNSSPLNDGADAILIGSEKGPIGSGAVLVWSPSASAREWGSRLCSNAERVPERGSHARGRMIKG